MKKIKCSEKVTNEVALEHLEEKKLLLNNILHRKATWIENFLRRPANKRHPPNK